MFESCFKAVFGYLVTLMLSVSLSYSSRINSDDIWLENPDQYAFASTQRGTYLHMPGTIAFVPSFTFTDTAKEFLVTSLVTAAIDNLDMYFFLFIRLLFSSLHSPETAIRNQNVANSVFTLYDIFLSTFWARTSHTSFRYKLLEPVFPILINHFKTLTGKFTTSYVYTGDPVFDLQVRMTLAIHKKSEQDVNDEETSREMVSQEYSGAILNLAPTPFHYSRSPDKKTVSGRILDALNLLDRNNGDEILLGKHPDGVFFVIILSPPAQKMVLLFLENTEITYSSLDPTFKLNPTAMDLEPISFLFSKVGSKLFNEALHSVFSNNNEDGYIESSPRLSTSGDDMSLLELYPYAEFLSYQSTSPGLVRLSYPTRKDQSHKLQLNCRNVHSQRECQTAIFWAEEEEGCISKHIRVIENPKNITRYFKHLTNQQNISPADHISSEYPYSLLSPSFIRIPFGLVHFISFIPLRSMLRKLHRKMLVGGIQLLSRSHGTSVTTDIIHPTQSFQLLERELVRGPGLAPRQSDPRSQFLVDLRAQDSYGEMVRRSTVSYITDRFKPWSYSYEASRYLYGYKEKKKNSISINRSKGMKWLTIGVSKKDKPSIKLLLQLNELGHFIKLSPELTHLLEQELNDAFPTPVSDSRKSWHHSLKQASRKARPAGVAKEVSMDQQNHKSRIPGIWEDAEFLNALNEIEIDIDWRETAGKRSTTSSPTPVNKAQCRGKQAFRRHYQSPGDSKPQATLTAAQPARKNTHIQIQNKDQIRNKIERQIQRYQWVNSIFNDLEKQDWSSVDQWVIKGKRVEWQGNMYDLYHKSSGGASREAGGQMATLFFIRVGNEAVVVAAGTHPKAIIHKPYMARKYHILWQHDEFEDKQLTTGKTYTLP